jgi:SAM-dependent methyltransferase
MTPRYRNLEPTWALKDILKSALMFGPGVARARKWLYATQGNPRRTILDTSACGWKVYDQALCELGVDLSGLTVVEVGAGPLRCNAIRFIASGAAKYIAIDRFDLLRSDPAASAAYRELLQSLTGSMGECARTLLSSGDLSKLFDDRIVNLVCRIEDIAASLPARLADLIVSHNVMESVDDFWAALIAMRDLVKPGGLMIHRVDLAIHDASQGVHPLSHLTFSDWMWRLISGRRAMPNRTLYSGYRAIVEQAGFKIESMPVTTRLDASEVNAIRPRLNQRYASYDSDELGVLDFLLVARLSA